VPEAFTAFAGREDTLGNWGYGPIESDPGRDWLDNEVGDSLASVIERALKAYQAGSHDLVEEPEAEAACALLVDCTSNSTKSRYQTIDLRYPAETRSLWDLAVSIVDQMMRNEDWLDEWDDPDEKRDALRELRSQLEQAKQENDRKTT
jgi:hypothetical protein